MFEFLQSSAALLASKQNLEEMLTCDPPADWEAYRCLCAKGIAVKDDHRKDVCRTHFFQSIYNIDLSGGISKKSLIPFIFKQLIDEGFRCLRPNGLTGRFFLTQKAIAFLPDYPIGSRQKEKYSITNFNDVDVVDFNVKKASISLRQGAIVVCEFKNVWNVQAALAALKECAGPKLQASSPSWTLKA
jgi:hypothetical protein